MFYCIFLRWYGTTLFSYRDLIFCYGKYYTHLMMAGISWNYYFVCDLMEFKHYVCLFDVSDSGPSTPLCYFLSSPYVLIIGTGANCFIFIYESKSFYPFDEMVCFYLFLFSVHFFVFRRYSVLGIWNFPCFNVSVGIYELLVYVLISSVFSDDLLHFYTLYLIFSQIYSIHVTYIFKSVVSFAGL